MEIYEFENDVEKILQEKADQKNIPLSGALELLPLCNMDCKMCYVKKTPEEMAAEGSLLSSGQWLSIVEQAREKGLLFLLLTGGEPLLYPDFKELYQKLLQMGLILTINTNGTLLKEDWADFFAAYPCRHINLTLYGKDNDTYARLCGNPLGFSQVMEAAAMLQARNIPFRFTSSITEENAGELPSLFDIARKFHVPLKIATYMFPAIRKGKNADTQMRMTPEAAAKCTLYSYQLQKNEQEMEDSIRRTLVTTQLPPRISCAKGYACHAGHSSFWMNWKGELLPCGMMTEPGISLLKHSFSQCWDYIVKTTQSIHYCEDCRKCHYQNICHVCPANLIAESGSYQKRPEYICQYTKELVKQMLSFFPYQWQKENYPFLLS